jgi:pyrroloquinoline-quinone synthase
MSLNPKLKDHLETAIFSLKLEEHPYFQALLSGKVSKSQFLKSQIEFSHAVSFFSRPMAQVISNIPETIPRMAIVDNLWEEHGKGIPEKVHGQTILTLIDRLGGNSSEIDQTSLTPNIEIFNQSLRGASAFEDYRFAASMFGAIERTFVDISGMICSAIINNGWLPEGKITHYSLHKEIDIIHAEDFLKVVNNDWDNEDHRKTIKDGVMFGAYLFTNVYSGFYSDLS